MESFIGFACDGVQWLFFLWVIGKFSYLFERVKNIQKYLELTGMPTEEEVLDKMWNDRFKPQPD